MSAPLRVLIVEDSVDDAELVVRSLRRAGFDVSFERVEQAAELTAQLDASEWDIVLADYNLPGFSGLDALRIVNERALDIPLVLVSGVIDVPTALEAMKAGAKDFVLKDDTSRLPSVIERELAESAQRERRRLAEAERDHALAELREANEQLRGIVRLTDIPFEGANQQQLVEALLERLVETLAADGAKVELLGDDGRLVALGSVGAADLASRHAVSMHYGGRVTGMLHVGWGSSYEPPEWQVRLIEMAADRCAIAIENARLYDQEHAIAQTLQKALLSASTSIPRLEVGQFYGSATIETLVGGDYYDVFEISPGCVAFSIGDVSGKGLGAASVTALIKNTIRALATGDRSPAAVMTKANAVVARFTEVETFVTGIFGVLDIETGVISYSNAGHPPPAITGPKGTHLLTTHGPLLGTLDGVRYAVSGYELEPGESIVLYTDGLTEARDPSGEFYGEARLLEFFDACACLAPQDIAARLFEEVWQFSDGKLRDDVALLVVRPRPE